MFRERLKKSELLFRYFFSSKKDNGIHSKNVNNIRKPIIIIGACSDLPLSDNLHKLSNPLKALEKQAVSKKKKYNNAR